MRRTFITVAVAAVAVFGAAGCGGNESNNGDNDGFCDETGQTGNCPTTSAPTFETIPDDFGS